MRSCLHRPRCRAPGLVAGVLCLLGAPGAALASEALPVPDPSVTTVAVRQDRTNRMSVPVFVNGQGPFRFLVDTGSDHTVVSGRLVSTLQLPNSGMATMHSFAGQSQVQLVAIEKLQLSSKVVPNITAASLEEAHIGAAGLLGINSLTNQRITLDFRSNVMTVSPGETRPQREVSGPGGGEVVVVRARPFGGQLVLTDARIGDIRVRVVIDTGAAMSVGNLELRRQLVRRRSADPSEMELTSVDGGTLVADVAVVPELRIGDLRLNNLPVAFVDAHPFRVFHLDRTPAMMLGMDVMSKMDEVSVDFSSRTVRFVLAAQAP